jgi:hypothetical protein
MLGQKPDSGVESTITPRANSQSTSSGVGRPVRLPHTRSRRNGGSTAGGGDPNTQPFLPARPLGPLRQWVSDGDWVRQGGQEGVPRRS